MRFADIILDLAALAKASRSVASRHLELRASQIDRYSRTSSISRSFRNEQNHTRSEDGVVSQALANDAATKDQKQQAHDKVPIQPGLGENASLQAEEFKAPQDFERESRPDMYQDFFQRGSLKDVRVQQPPAISRPDQSAILTQLKEKANLTQTRDHEGTISRSSYNNPEDIPPDVDVNIFHTSRGSQMLEGQKDVVRPPRPNAPPTKPSWFKDFGHDKPKTPEEPKGAKPLPSISKTKGQGSSPLENSAASADVAIGSRQFAEHINPQVEERPKSSPPALKIATKRETDGESASTSTTKSELLGTKEFTSQQIEKEPTQMINDILSKEGANGAKQAEPVASSLTNEPSAPAHTLRESKVPATRLSRLWNYGGLAAGMLGGALSEGLSRGFGGGGQGSVMLSAGNMERLVAKLSRMRGAALKIGQMMSFQDAKTLPGPLQEVLQRVQDRADYMPAWQRDRVLVASLGPEWRNLFEDFEETPIAAASIGQVHRATLKSGEKVAVKIQFPGVADSINSDLDNLSMLLTASKMLPKGLYLNKTIDNARTELGWECDYERELECGKKYKALLADEGDVFAVPEIHAHASGKHVLTMQFMEGVGVTRVKSFTQDQRDWIGTQILRLCLREIAEFRFMQTDPNWTNFLYNTRTNKLELLDFGASRAYPDSFVTQYLSLLAAAARQDREAVVDFSQRLGYLTGHESRAMLDAHVASILTLAEPFLQAAPDVYDFADQTITDRVRALIPVMAHERLTPPPEETYSLHRKLSGAFLLCARLGSRVRCRDLFVQALEKTDLDVVRR
ncbi:ABC1-domain-containing protein [Xylariaceae sp. FL1651]|nr:ABC1-domain-containing protein [Xylariaceae sp. FL1651]